LPTRLDLPKCAGWGRTFSLSLPL